MQRIQKRMIPRCGTVRKRRIIFAAQGCGQYGPGFDVQFHIVAQADRPGNITPGRDNDFPAPVSGTGIKCGLQNRGAIGFSISDSSCCNKIDLHVPLNFSFPNRHR